MRSSIVKWIRWHRRLWLSGTRARFPVAMLSAMGLAASAGASPVSDVLSQLQQLRERGCGESTRYEAPLEHLGALDAAAQQWASGRNLQEAIDPVKYTATRVMALHLHGALAQGADVGQSCRSVRVPSLRHVGIYQSGGQTWLILAAPAFPGIGHDAPRPPSLNSAAPASMAPTLTPHPLTPDGPVATPTALLPDRVLELVNAARAHGRQCGEHYFTAVPAVQLSSTLNAVAMQHATDMAQQGYFEHIDLSGHTPADRVKAAGYRERLVGENIAYGPTSAEEVVAGWLDSPGHCENIMDSRFTQMGLALAASERRTQGPYWVQLLVEPAILTARP